MDTQNNEIQQKQPAPKKKKRRGGLILVLLLLILAIGGGAGYYFYARQQPRNQVDKFLASIQKMDFASMESMLQSNDLSALDNADVRNGVYTEFFQSINAKMSYKITKTSFDIQNGTARVTARIKYIDGSDIYKETISEFLRQIVSTAFSGQQLTEEEIEQTLSSILIEKSKTLEDKFAETDIVYPLIKTTDAWKIVALDDETVKIMSANFKSVEDEINNSINTLDDTSSTTEEEVTETPAADGDTIDMDTEKFSIHYTQHKVANDFAGNPCLMLYYDFTNNSSSASSAMVDVNIQASQNGNPCQAAIPESNEEAIDLFMAEIQPGETVNVCQVFALTDTSDVTLQASEAFSFGAGQTTKQILKLQ